MVESNVANFTDGTILSVSEKKLPHVQRKYQGQSVK